MSASNRGKPGAHSDTDQIVRSDPEQQRVIRRWSFGSIAAVVLVWLLFRYWGAHANPYALLHRLYGLTYLCGLGLLAAAWYSVRYARRVFASGQYPPPGGWVLGDTRVRRDAAARAVGVQILACAVTLAVLGLYALYLPHSITASGRQSQPIEVAPMSVPAPAIASPANASSDRHAAGATPATATSPTQDKPKNASDSAGKHTP